MLSIAVQGAPMRAIALPIPITIQLAEACEEAQRWIAVRDELGPRDIIEWCDSNMDHPEIAGVMELAVAGPWGAVLDAVRAATRAGGAS